MQSADQTCPLHHCCVGLHIEPGVDQHRRSDALRGTVCSHCSTLLDEHRTNLYAVSRQNMSTASLLRRPAHRTRGGAVNRTRENSQKYTFPELDILQILHISHICYIFFSHTRAGRCAQTGAAGCANVLFCIKFHIWFFFSYENRVYVYLLHIPCIFLILVT